MHADSRLLAEAFRCGGDAYVLKQSAGEELIFAIRQVLDGNKFISPAIATEGNQNRQLAKPHLSKNESDSTPARSLEASQ